jgi:hypothetical protein
VVRNNTGACGGPGPTLALQVAGVELVLVAADFLLGGEPFDAAFDLGKGVGVKVQNPLEMVLPCR